MDVATRLGSRIINFVEVQRKHELTYTESFLINEDLRPVLIDRREWKANNFWSLHVSRSSLICAFCGPDIDLSSWVATSFNVNTWMITSSMIQLGLSWWQACICVCIGNGLAAPYIVLNGRPGAVFHITFPVVARASFGIWGSLWCVFNRAAMACIWYGVQTSIDGEYVLVMLRAMWPSVQNITNTLPPSSGTTTRDFMCFFLFWLVSLPAIWLPIHQVRHLFTVKAIIVPIAGITFFIWCIIKARGVGPIVHQPATVHGSPLGWAMVASITSCINSQSTIITNAPDFASRARRPSEAVMSQMLSIPIVFALVSFIGIIVSSSSQAIYGEAIWSPMDLLGRFLDGSPTHATRFGVWFIAAAFALATVGSMAHKVHHRLCF